MGLETRIDNPHAPSKKINAYLNVVGYEVVFSHGGELRLALWHSKGARDTEGAKPLKYITLPLEQDLITDDKLVPLPQVYSRLKEKTLKAENISINLTNSKDVYEQENQGGQGVVGGEAITEAPKRNGRT